MQSGEIVRLFFAQDGVVRKLGLETTDDQLACIPIGRRDWIARGFPIDGRSPLVVTHQDGAGFERQLFRDFEFPLHSLILFEIQRRILPRLIHEQQCAIRKLSRRASEQNKLRCVPAAISEMGKE